MAIRNVVQVGDEILRKKAKKVEKIDERLIILIDDLIDTMREYGGIGLAATQVGVLKAVFVVETEEEGLFEMINPEILDQTGSIEADEGCLSVLGKTGLVERPEYVKISGQNRRGEIVEVEAEGWLAKAFSHEMDHLNGILFVDKAISISDAKDE